MIDTAWYISTVTYAAVTSWAASTSVTAGAVRRQLATPTAGNERCFVCIVAGTTGAAEPTWVLTRGAKTTDNTATWQECTGVAGVNGDLTNTLPWSNAGIKNTAVTLGQIIKRVSGTSLQICTTAGTAGNGAEPAFNDTAGVTTTDGTVTWTSLGVVGNFAGWTSPHSRVKNAVLWAVTLFIGAPACIYYVSSDHAETLAGAINIAGASSSFLYPSDKYISVNRAGSVPPVAADVLAGAKITTTGTGDLTITGYAYLYGFTFTCGTGATTSSIYAGQQGNMTFQECSFVLANTNSSSYILAASYGNANNANFRWIDCTVGFGNAAQAINGNGQTNFYWQNRPSLPVIVGATIPSTFFVAGSYLISATFVGLDLSQMGSGKMIFSGGPMLAKFINCKIDNAVTMSQSAPNVSNNADCYIIGCSGSGTIVRNERYMGSGTTLTETTIVRTGGANDGVNAFSHKIFTNLYTPFTLPAESMTGFIFNATTGSAKTLTVHIVNDGLTLKDTDIWIEVDYLGSAASPISTAVSDRAATVISVGANKPTSTETWTTTGLATPVKQKCSVTFTPQLAGPIRWRLLLVKPSTTVYFCPKADLT